MGGGVLLSNIVLIISTFPYFIPGDSAAGRVGGQGGFSGGSKRLQPVRGGASVGAREGG